MKPKEPNKPRKKKAKKETEYWLAYNNVFYQVDTKVFVNNDPHFGG